MPGRRDTVSVVIMGDAATQRPRSVIDRDQCFDLILQPTIPKYTRVFIVVFSLDFKMYRHFAALWSFCGGFNDLEVKINVYCLDLLGC